MTDRKLDSDIEPEKQRLADAVGHGDPEILGYGVMYTVGADWNCLVPRDWLMDRVNDLGIPQWVAPNQPRPSDAYKRAIKRMREDYLDDTWSVEAPRMDKPDVTEPHSVTVDLKEGDAQYLWHVRAEVLFTEDEHPESPEGGQWIQHHLGYISYDSENEFVRVQRDDDLDKEDILYDVWKDVANTAIDFFDEMQHVHIAQDVRKMMYYSTRDYTDKVVQLRRSVYLFPAGMADFVEKMSTLYSEIDTRFKDGGEPVAIRTFEVLDTEDKRDWVQHRVEQTLEENVESILEEAFEEFDEGETADQVVKIIREQLDDDEDTAETYNALLEAEIEIEEVLQEQKEQVADEEKEDIVDRVLSQTDVDGF